MKKVIITGPTGAIGMALINKCIEMNMEVTAICHRRSKRIKNFPITEKLQIVECDLAELVDFTDELGNNYDTFYHLAWACTVGETRNDVSAQMNNIKYTIDAVELAKRLGCKRFIGAGSQAEYGRSDKKLNSSVPTFPENAYGIAKLCAGQLSRIRCEQLGLEHIWTRILSVYGPYDGENAMISTLIRGLKNKQELHFTKCEQIWDYCYSDDAANALYLLGEGGKSGKTYCIGSGVEKPLIEYLRCVTSLIDPQAKLGIGDIPYGEKQVMYLCADISELKQDVGFEPKYTFVDGIKETIKWFDKQG